MSSFRSPDLLERRSNAATIKKVMLEKFRAARQDPAFEQQRLKKNRREGGASSPHCRTRSHKESA